MSLRARFTGLPVSEGTATGILHVVDTHVVDTGLMVSVTPDEVASAFAAVSAERFALADRLRADGRQKEAAIIEIGALIATDPALCEPALDAVRGGEDVTSAVRAAAEKQAAKMEVLTNRELAERAGDIRQIGQAVLEHLGTRGQSSASRSSASRSSASRSSASAGSASPSRSAAYPDGEFILVRREVSAVDLIELADAGLVGAVSVTGSATSHAAIIARGLGLPMIAGADAAVLALPSGQHGVLNADKGELLVGDGPIAYDAEALRTGPHQTAPHQAAEHQTAPHQATPSQAAAPGSVGPARTADGREITILCNVASAVETRRGLAAGASGVGLLRTEIPFAQALAWPTRAEHRAMLDPILSLLAGRSATVRLLDFSGDKIPPFLRATRPSGPGGHEPPLLAHPAALADQLSAILEAGQDTSLSVLIPMVSSLAEVSTVRAALTNAAGQASAYPAPRLGIMVELQSTAADAQAFATAVDFFSIGTNDLTADVLVRDRYAWSATPAMAAHPKVLALIAHVAVTARQAGIPVSVCGDSAADPLVLPLLIGAGIDILSVPAARVGRVRDELAALDTKACATLLQRALKTTTAEEVWDLVPQP
jgi:phosphoenolpyruvate-protein kinase (PTS system EI component)